LKHFHLSADGKVLTGKVVRVTPPKKDAVHALDIQAEPVYYDFEYAFDPAAPPASIELKEDVLNEVPAAHGTNFECSYVTGIEQEGRAGQDGLLLTPKMPVSFKGDWTPLPAAPAAAAPGTDAKEPQPAPRIDKGGMIRDYLVHGVEHI